MFRAVVRELERRLPLARAISLKLGYFHCGGGAFWFDQARLTRRSGVVEGASPECRGPRQLLLHQRIQDLLVAEATRDTRMPGLLAPLKCDRDAEGNTFGGQENYETDIATGWRWQLWRIGIWLLTPLVVLGWAGAIVLVIGLLLYYALAGLLYLLARPVAGVLEGLVGRPLVTPLRILLLGREPGSLLGGEPLGDAFPSWLEPFLHVSQLLLFLPLAAGLALLGRWTAFVPQRRAVIGFLVTRPIITGAGRLRHDGRFEIAAKASALNTTAGIGSIFGVRPLFELGHFLKALLCMAVNRSPAFTPLLARRQRLQIGLGDGNLCQEAEFLKVGMTLLVLDAAEAGLLHDAPRPRRPIRALRRIIADPTLRATIRLTGGRRWNALQVQRFYLERCQALLDSRGGESAEPEAAEVVRRWREVLEALEDVQRSPDRLVGRLDWVTKRMLLAQLGPGQPLDVARKLDLRYHELSPDGYFERLRQAGMTHEVLDPLEIEADIGVPPPDTPAEERGQAVRTAAASFPPLLRVGWRGTRRGEDLGSTAYFRTHQQQRPAAGNDR